MLNNGDGSYGLGVVVTADSKRIAVQDPITSAGPSRARKTDNMTWGPGGWRAQEVTPPPGKRYDVYFTKFERIITFHGDYLEKV